MSLSKAKIQTCHEHPLSFIHSVLVCLKVSASADGVIKVWWLGSGDHSQSCFAGLTACLTELIQGAPMFFWQLSFEILLHWAGFWSDFEVRKPIVKLRRPSSGC